MLRTLELTPKSPDKPFKHSMLAWMFEIELLLFIIRWLLKPGLTTIIGPSVCPKSLVKKQDPFLVVEFQLVEHHLL